jgi:glycosyltransferase involved in cell wall biosynthesis
MRVLHVISGLNPRSGGPPVAVASLAAAQAGVGMTVGVLTYADAPPAAPGPGAPATNPYAAFPGFDRVRLVHVPHPDRFERVLGRAARRAIDQIIDEYDVVHIHGIWESIALQAAACARHAHKPYIIAPHGMLSAWALSEKRFKKRVALALGYRAMIANASALHALSDHERLGMLGAEPGSEHQHANIAVIPNGVFLQDIDPLPAPGTFRAKHPELGSDPYIFFLARLHTVKGLDLLADAFAQLLPEFPKLRLVIAGPDYNAGEALKAQVQRLGVAERVHMLGAIYGRERFDGFADAACFCLPSKHEGFSMSIAEAMASRCPVVITENCHLPSVREHQAGEVHERTVPALRDALRRVLGDPALRARYADNARRLVEERYTWPSIARQSREVYGQIASGAPGVLRLQFLREGHPAKPAVARPGVAMIVNARAPYRYALHTRIDREMPEIQLHTVYTHGEQNQAWAEDDARDIRPVHFGRGEPLRAGINWRASFHEYAKGGRIIDWLRDNDIRAVFLSGYNDAGRLRILRWCYATGLPVFMVADSNAHGDFARGFRFVLKRAVVARVIRWSTLVLPFGQFGSEYFRRYGAPAWKINFMPYEPDYAVIEGLTKAQVDAVCVKHALRPDRKRIVFCGRLVRAKRPDLAVAAMIRVAQQRPDWELVMIGSGVEREACERMVPAELKDRVRWLGFIGDAAEIGALYRASEVFLLPSDYEPWGVVVNEAACAGCCMLTSSVVGAAPELVRDRINGRSFPAGDLDALVEALLDCTNPDNLARYQSATRQVLAEWRRTADPIVAMRLALARAGVIGGCAAYSPPHADSRPTHEAALAPNGPALGGA